MLIKQEYECDSCNEHVIIIVDDSLCDNVIYCPLCGGILTHKEDLEDE